MSKEDFLCWDNDIDFDELLGEYTDHEEMTSHQKKNTVTSALTVRRSWNPYLVFGDTWPSSTRKAKQKVFITKNFKILLNDFYKALWFD